MAGFWALPDDLDSDCHTRLVFSEVQLAKLGTDTESRKEAFSSTEFQREVEGANAMTGTNAMKDRVDVI